MDNPMKYAFDNGRRGYDYFAFSWKPNALADKRESATDCINDNLSDHTNWFAYEKNDKSVPLANK